MTHSPDLFEKPTPTTGHQRSPLQSDGALRDGLQEVEQKRCRHCGLLSNSEFCCAGCAGVYAALSELDLLDFYQFRDLDGGPPVPVVEPPLGGVHDFSDVEPSIDRGSATYTFEIAGIHCAGCLWVLERLPALVPGVSKSLLNFSTGELAVWFDAHVTSLDRIAGFLIKLGYVPRHPKAIDPGIDNRRSALVRIAVAGFGAANTMMLAVSLFQGFFTGIDPDIAHLFRWLSLGLTAPVVLWAGMPLYERAGKSLKNGRVHIELPLTVAIFAAFFLSAANTVLDRPYVYFDSVCLLIFLLLVSREVQKRATAAAQRGARLGWSVVPDSVLVLENNHPRRCRIGQLCVGSTIIVAAGERIAADGVVITGSSSVDTSIMTVNQIRSRSGLEQRSLRER